MCRTTTVTALCFEPGMDANASMIRLLSFAMLLRLASLILFPPMGHIHYCDSSDGTETSFQTFVAIPFLRPQNRVSLGFLSTFLGCVHLCVYIFFRPRRCTFQNYPFHSNRAHIQDADYEHNYWLDRLGGYSLKFVQVQSCCPSYGASPAIVGPFAAPAI